MSRAGVPVSLFSPAVGGGEIGTRLPDSKAVLYEAVRFQGTCIEAVQAFYRSRYQIEIPSPGPRAGARNYSESPSLMIQMEQRSMKRIAPEAPLGIHDLVIWGTAPFGHAAVVADLKGDQITIVESNYSSDAGEGGVRTLNRKSAEWKRQLRCFWRPRPGSLPQPRQSGHLHTTYRAHVGDIGDLAPAERGEIAGTIQEQRRLEAVQFDSEVLIRYRARVQETWQPDVPNGIWAGTKGMSKPLTGISVRAETLGITTECWVHFAFVGWQGPFKNGMEATSGNSQIEAVLFLAYRR